MAQYPTVSQVKHAASQTSTQDLVNEGAQALRGSRDDDGKFVEAALDLLEQSLKSYNQALNRADLTDDQRRTLQLQIGKTHAYTAIAEFGDGVKAIKPSNFKDERVRHHVQQASAALQKYSRDAPDSTQAFEKVSDVALKLLQVLHENVSRRRKRVSLLKSISSFLLGGEVEGYRGPRVPRIMLSFALLHDYHSLAEKTLGQDGTYLTRLFHALDRRQKKAPNKPEVEQDDEDPVQTFLYIHSENHAMGQELEKVQIHLTKAKESGLESEEKLTELEQILEQHFTLHGRLCVRAQAVKSLCNGADELRKFNEDADNANAFSDAVVYFRAAANDAGCKTVEILEKKVAADFDVVALALHLLARAYEQRGLNQKARECHKQVVFTGFVLDPEFQDETQPTDMLRNRQWFLKSMDFLRAAQQADVEAEQAQRQSEVGALPEAGIPFHQQNTAQHVRDAYFSKEGGGEACSILPWP